jgi:hypothetical protein
MPELHQRTNGLGRGLKWLVACSVKVEFSSVLTESEVFLEPIHLPESELFDVGKGSRDQNQHETHKGESMAILLAILDFLFGCHHVHLSRVFTLQGETYRVCCDCGAKFAYSLETMSIERRIPLTPVLTRFRIA